MFKDKIISNHFQNKRKLFLNQFPRNFIANFRKQYRKITVSQALECCVFSHCCIMKFNQSSHQYQYLDLEDFLHIEKYRADLKSNFQMSLPSPCLL